MSTISPLVNPSSGRKKARSRLGDVLAYLSAGGRVRVEELIRETGASPATIRRDLRRLERDGLVRRDHGGAVMSQPVAYEAFLDDPGFRDQVHMLAAEKRRIGAAAAALIENGETIGIAPGTTAAQIARMLQTKKELVVVTNGLNVAMDLSRRKDIRVHLTGGYLSGEWFALVGPRAMEFVPTMFTDKFFFGANGVHAEHGVTDRHPEEAAVNRAMLGQSRKRILVVDHRKFGQVAGCVVCPISDLNMIITDSGAPDRVVAPFLDRGIEVLRV
jgi:DeoR/GlpR family transcriptional regulator of sugar metabolism